MRPLCRDDLCGGLPIMKSLGASPVSIAWKATSSPSLSSWDEHGIRQDPAGCILQPTFACLKKALNVLGRGPNRTSPQVHVLQHPLVHFTIDLNLDHSQVSKMQRVQSFMPLPTSGTSYALVNLEPSF